MRTLFLICAALIFSNSALAQNTCSQYYPFSQGTLSEITSYDKKGKVSAVSEYTVTESGENLATLSHKISDNTGEVLAESSFDMTCSDNGVEIDIKSLFTPQLSAQYQNMETSITGTGVIVPNNMKVGDVLPDATMNVSVDMIGISMNIVVMMLDRTVVDQENVTTPAGTFDCTVIEYTSTVKMGFERTSSAKQWIAKGVGLVMQEDYNKKGKVTGSTKLTKFSK